MSHMTLRVAVIGASFSVFFYTTTVEAAKGIKNGNQGHGTHTVSGVVIRVVPDKTGYGVFELKTPYNHKKTHAVNAGAAANGGGTNQQLRTLNVSSSTKFAHHMGGMTNMVNAAALQRGQRVRVQFTGQNAEEVHIYTPMHTSGRRMSSNYVRHRTSVYHPHHYHHRR